MAIINENTNEYIKLNYFICRNDGICELSVTYYKNEEERLKEKNFDTEEFSTFLKLLLDKIKYYESQEEITDISDYETVTKLYEYVNCITNNLHGNISYNEIVDELSKYVKQPETYNKQPSSTIIYTFEYQWKFDSLRQAYNYFKQTYTEPYRDA